MLAPCVNFGHSSLANNLNNRGVFSVLPIGDHGVSRLSPAEQSCYSVWHPRWVSAQSDADDKLGQNM